MTKGTAGPAPPRMTRNGLSVSLAQHDERWGSMFAEEAMRLRAGLAGIAVAIHHIGSTAVPGMLAKPVIDIVCEVRSLDAVDAAAPLLQDGGYRARGENGIEGRRYFTKSDAHGVRTCHLHVFERGSPAIALHLALRDYLRANPDVAADYSRLKQAIVRNGTTTRADYQAAKAPFIAKTLAAALRGTPTRSPLSD